jgi:hypothetical protein
MASFAIGWQGRALPCPYKIHQSKIYQSKTYSAVGEAQPKFSER